MVERFVVLWAFLFGSLIVFVVPPFQVADEFNHFYRAWQVSDGILVGVRTADNRLGGDLPVSVAKITQPFRSLPFHPENRIKSNTIFYNLSLPLDAQNRQFQDFSNTAIYAPTAYLPQIIAIHIGKSLNAPPLSIFYFSRFLTLIFWLSMVYAALKIMPIKKNLFAALALLPSSLFINASASGDVVTNGCSFLLLALFIKLIVEKEYLIKLKNIKICCLIFILSLIISINKLAYFPIIFIIFLIKKEQFNGLKNKLIATFFLIISNIFIIIFWSKTIQHLFIKFEEYNPNFRIGQQLNENVDPSVQIAFIIHNSLIFSKIAILSLIKTLPHTLIHYVGKFGWEKNYLPLSIIAILLFLILIQAILNEKNQIIPSEQFGFFSKNNLIKNQLINAFLNPLKAINLIKKNKKELINLTNKNAELITEFEPDLTPKNAKFLIFNSKNTPLSIKAKFGLFGIAFLMTFSFTAAMYVLWNPVGSLFIEGLGGKYFIPIYPLFFLALPTFDLSKNHILNYLAQPKVLFSTLILSLIWSVLQVIMRYYI